MFLPMLSGGGAERVMVTLANAFADRGIRTDFVLAKAEGPYIKHVSPRVRIVDLKASRVTTSILPLTRYIRGERPQAMLSALRHANIVAILAKKFSHVPLRLVISERNTLRAAQVYTGDLRKRSIPFFMRSFYPMADEVVAISKGVAEDLTRLIGLRPEHIRVIYNPIDAMRIEQASQVASEHPWLSSRHPPIILGAGRLTLQKDFQSLILAFSMFCEKAPARLVILGEGELRNELQALIDRLNLSTKILLPGFVDNPYSWMRAAKVFVLSSRWEGLSCVLIESMACGTKVVSTDCPSGPSEVLENGKWGKLVPVGDVKALATAMSDAFFNSNSPDVRERAADFSVDKAAKDYLKALNIY
ncbi:glycosyltransferase [Desulfonatronum sp. SC1]|uniref:glycosyltransferase n=1 Tax=Desulfonatronum sp. SC1 TaxID=2109626 RepID=UPI0018EE4CF2|nr:glycosyltransferase [Desulfonatronum sp. SC1]